MKTPWTEVRRGATGMYLHIDELILRKDDAELCLAGDKDARNRVAMELKSLCLTEHVLSLDPTVEYVIITLRQAAEEGLDILDSVQLNPFLYNKRKFGDEQ